MSSIPEIYLSVLNALREPLFVLSSDFQVIFANNAFWSALPAKTPTGALPLPQSPWFWPDASSVDYSPECFNSIFVSREGEEFAVKLRACNLVGGNFLIQLLDGINGAETNRDFHSQRLQTLGMLASGVAHDFNNVLTGILGHLAYLKVATKLEAQPLDSLNSIEEGAKKASEIAQQIVRFSKSDSTERSKLVNLSQVVERTCRLLRGAISAKYQLMVEVPEDLEVNVLGVEARVAQILVNLVVNARDACSDGGTITVSVDQINDPARLSALLSTDELPCDSYALIKVEDSGHGMAPEILDRIFEPYFSTKAENGTGIGLYTVLTIIKSFGGAIEVESAPDKGTAVCVYFPQLSLEGEALQDEPSLEEPVEIKPLTEESRASILVVDDEYTVRNVLSLALQHLGYDVVVASSGHEAIAKYQARDQPFDLVLLDMLMPQMSGERTFQELKEIDPQVKVLIISGFAPEEAIKAVLNNGGLGFIQKPFTIEALARRMQEFLQ